MISGNLQKPPNGKTIWSILLAKFSLLNDRENRRKESLCGDFSLVLEVFAWIEVLIIVFVVSA